MSPGPSAERGVYSLLNKIKILLSWREAMDRNDYKWDAPKLLRDFLN